MNIKNKVLVAFVLFLGTQLLGQNTEYAKQIIGKLSASNMYGRGYYNDGVNLSADVIIEYLNDLNISSLDSVFKQNFFIDVNTFPESTICRINGQKLKPCDHYFVGSNSCPVNGVFKLLRINDALVDSTSYIDSLKLLDLSETFLIVDQANSKKGQLYATNARGYLFTANKIYWKLSGSNVQEYYTTLWVVDSLIPENAETIQLIVNPKFLFNFKSSNILAKIPATQPSDSFIVFTAHFDHLGVMGSNCMFPGANDNASGVAMLLELGKYFIDNPVKRYNIALMFFAAEEVGLYGSEHYVQNPVFPLENISCLINFDMVGTGSQGLSIVNGKANERITKTVQTLNAQNNWFSDIRVGGSSCSSDHCFFALKNVPAVFFFTRGAEHQYYHVPEDRADGLPLTKWNELKSLTIMLSEQWGEN